MFILDLLKEAQSEGGFVSPEEVKKISQNTGTPIADIYSLITFFNDFKTAKPRKHVIKICTCSPCALGGINRIIDALEEKLGIKLDENNNDGKIQLESVGCIGQCDNAPAIMVDDKVYRGLSIESAMEIVDELID